MASAATKPSCGNVPNALCKTANDEASGQYRWLNPSPFLFEGATRDAFQTEVVVTDPVDDDQVLKGHDGSGLKIGGAFALQQSAV